MRALVLLSLFILILSAGVSTAQAPRADFTVNSTKDRVDINPGDGICADLSGKCTLRAAVMEANALPGNDQITLTANTYVLTIPGDGEDAAATGDLDLLADYTSIGGPAAGGAVIDANRLDRAFDIFEFAEVGLQYLTIINGNSGSDPGGAVRVAHISGLADVTIANSTGGDGGGVACTPCNNITLSTVVLSDNSGVRGGGLFIDGGQLNGNTLTVTRNAASDNGGGVMLINAIGSLNASSVSFNTAIGAGGGVSFEDGVYSIGSTFLTGNVASDGGGGISVNSSQLIIDGSLVSQNRGSDGGGIFAIESNGSIDQTSLIGNTLSGVTGLGGGAYFLNSDYNVKNTTVSGNAAYEGGGLAFVNNTGVHSTFLSNVTVTDNATVPFVPANAGGISAVALNGGSVQPANTILSGNGSKQCTGTLLSPGGNLFANTTDCAITTAPDDLTNVTDPLLGMLQHDTLYGLEVVHVPLPGSMALNNGSDANCLSVDQRGAPRAASFPDFCDIGAVEGAAISLITNGSFEDANGVKSLTGWTAAGLSGDKVKCNDVKQPPALGACAMTFKDPVGKLKQTINVTPDDYVLYFGAFINSNVTAPFKPIMVKLFNSQNALISSEKLEIGGGNLGYRWVAFDPMAVAPDLAKIKVFIQFKSLTGKMTIDGVFLAPLPAVLRDRREPLPPPDAPDGFRRLR